MNELIEHKGEMIIPPSEISTWLEPREWSESHCLKLMQQILIETLEDLKGLETALYTGGDPRAKRENYEGLQSAILAYRFLVNSKSLGMKMLCNWADRDPQQVSEWTRKEWGDKYVEALRVRRAWK